MKIIKYRPIIFPKLRIIICCVILALLVSSLINVFDMINRAVNYSVREVAPEKLYYVYEGETIESNIVRDNVVLYYQETVIDAVYVHFLILTPEKKLMYIYGNSDEFGDHYSYELMMENGTYDSFWFFASAQKMDDATRKSIESRITSEFLTKYGVTLDDLSDIYLKMTAGQSPPASSEIMSYIILCALYVFLVFLGVWPFLRNRIYHSRVRSGKMDIDPLELKAEGLDNQPGQTFYDKKDSFWLTNNSGLDKDENDGYYNNINMSDNDGDNGNTYN